MRGFRKGAEGILGVTLIIKIVCVYNPRTAAMPVLGHVRRANTIALSLASYCQKKQRVASQGGAQPGLKSTL